MFSGHSFLVEHSKDVRNTSDVNLDIKPSLPSTTENGKSTSQNTAPTSLPKEQPIALPFSFLMREKEPAKSEKDKEREETLKKTREFLAIFQEVSSKTSDNEKLLGDFSCAYQKEKLLVHGRMYISDNNLCFHSTFFGETKKVIKLQKIRNIFKRNTAILFPNAIEVSTKRKKHFFSSFIFRDQAYNLLWEAWEKAMKQPKVTDTTSSNETSDPLGSSEEEVIEEFLEDSEHDEPKENLNSSPEDKTPTPPIQNITEVSSPASDKIESSVQSISHDEQQNDTSNYLVPSKEGSLCDHYDTTEKKEFYITETIAIESTKFFQEFLSDKSDFIIDLHNKENYRDQTIIPWKTDSANCCITRVLNFISPIKARIGPKSAPVQQTQRCCYINPGHLVLECLSETKDVPYGDAFAIYNYIEVLPHPNNKSQSIIKSYSYVKFLRNIWAMKSMIEKTCVDGAKEYCADLISLVKEKLSASPKELNLLKPGIKHKTKKSPKAQSERRKSVELTPTPSQITEAPVVHITLRDLVKKELEDSKVKIIAGFVFFTFFFMILIIYLLSRRLSNLENQLSEVSIQNSLVSQIQQLKLLFETEVISSEEYTHLLNKLKSSPQFFRFKEIFMG